MIRQKETFKKQSLYAYEIIVTAHYAMQIRKNTGNLVCRDILSDTQARKTREIERKREKEKRGGGRGEKDTNKKKRDLLTRLVLNCT